MRLTVIVALVTGLAGPVVLEGQEHAPAIEPTRAMSPMRAQLLSVAHTALPVSSGLLLLSRGSESDLYAIPGYWLFAYGVVVGPSTGSLYAHDHRRVATGLALRSAGVALVAVSAWNHILSGGFDPDQESVERLSWDPLSIAGATAIAAGAVYGIVVSRASAEQYNRKPAAADQAGIAISPSIFRSGALGVHLNVRF